MKWRRIESLPNNNTFVLAKTNDWRLMVFKASILFDNIKRTKAKGQPEHLQFPATHYLTMLDMMGIPNE